MALTGELYPVSYTRAAILGRLYPGGYTRAAVPGRLYPGGYTRKAIPGRLYPGGYTWAAITGVNIEICPSVIEASSSLNTSSLISKKARLAFWFIVGSLLVIT